MLFILTIVLGGSGGYLIFHLMTPGEFRGITTAVLTIVLIYLSALSVYRVFLRFFPLPEGEITVGSSEEFATQINILFYLLIFNSLIRSHIIPVPILRLVYLALGATLGRNTYSAGVLLDPPLISAGANCIIGHNAVIFAHVIEGTRLSLHRVRLGDNVTIGAMAVVMAGVTIGDGAIVSAGAVVTKGTFIGPGEIWGGVPAKMLRTRQRKLSSTGDQVSSRL